MKKSNLFCLMLVIPASIGFAQSSQNYVKSYRASVEGLTNLSVVNNKDQVRESVTYFDGLGRPLQSVQRQASPTGYDMVSPIYYDEFGRESRSYLPFRRSSTDGSYQLIAMDPASYGPGNAHYNFYNSQGYDAADRPFPFSEVVFEHSPLNRVLEQGSPGEAWQPLSVTANGGATVKMKYLFNISTDQVKIWRYRNNALSYGGVYASGTISKMEKTDEDGNKVQEFVDKLGRTVLRRMFLSATVKADTYYVYGDNNLLYYVFPPELSTTLTTTIPTTTELENWAFQYKYDSRNRMIQKKVPGASWVYMVYDKRDRLVLTQDGQQRTSSQWIFTKYDALNRPVATGIYTNTATSQAQMQNVVNNFYAPLAPSNAWFEAPGTTVHGYTNKSFPLVSDPLKYLTITYYDNYTHVDNSLVNHLPTNFNYVSKLGYDNAYNAKVTGYATGSKVSVLGKNSWIHTVMYYDNKYRPIQSVSYNQFKDVLDRRFTKYRFNGEVEARSSDQLKDGENQKVNKQFLLDHMGRLISIVYQVPAIIEGVEVAFNQKTVENEYGELGQLLNKGLHVDAQGQAMQSVDYNYNIRGWLTGINGMSSLSDANASFDDFFGTNLFYNKSVDGSIARYNGNISAIGWKTHNDDQSSSLFTYNYDGLNRLTSAKYSQGSLLSSWNKVLGTEDLHTVDNLTYDMNGNILSLRRYTQEITGKVVMDNLVYNYGTSSTKSNRLLKVTDNGNDHKGFIDGTNTGNDYDFDANGNLKKDLNKGITAITYNYLNLPKLISKSDGKSIEYVYDATGIKIQQIVNDTQVKTSDYLGEYIYENDTIALIQHEEGRIVKDASGGWEYQYHIKDHLGNVRTTFTANPKEIDFTLNYESNVALPDDEDLFEELNGIVSLELFDHTDATTTYTKSQRLTGASNSRIGSVLAIPVGKGDKLSAEVYAKYEAVTSSPNTGLTALGSMLINAITGGSSMINEFGQASINNSYTGTNGAIIGTSGFQPDQNGIYGFLNVLFISTDNEVNVDASRFAFDQISSGAQQIGTSTKSSHDLMSIQNFEAPSNGIAIIYVSNEQNYQTNIYFDDLKVSVNQHPVVQSDDYYPFGLEFNSYQRVTAKENRYNTFQDQEKITALDLNWIQFKWRNHDPTIGRFFNVDPLAESFVHNSSYAFSENQVINAIELEGLEKVTVFDKFQQLSEKEKEILLYDPTFYKALDVEKNANEAYAKTNEVYGYNGKGDITDAFRHAYWMARNAQEVGEDFSEKWGDAHEDGTPSDEATHVYMDIHNNNVGVEIGKNNPDATANDLEVMIQDAISNGDMIIMNKEGKLIKSNGKQLSKKEVRRAEKAFKIITEIQERESKDDDQEN